MFVRIDLIQSGLVPINKIVTKNVALGKNLVVTRASNKGGVRVRCPLNFAALGMEGVRASDQHGQSKLEKRNKNAVCVEA